MVEFATSFLDNRVAALDPACGNGVFLQPMLSAGFSQVVGIDVDDEVLGEITKTCGDDKRLILQRANSLLLLRELAERFDLVATNPPFSAKYGRVTDATLLDRFELGFGRNSEAVEVLFLELCVRCLREGGMLAIILPEGIFANLPQERVRKWLIRHMTPIAVVSLSRSFFAAKCCVLIARKEPALPSDEVLLLHAEVEDDLRKVKSEGMAKRVADLVENMSPLYHLKQPDFHSRFPLVPLKELLLEMRSGSTEYGGKRQFADSGIPFVSAKTVTPFGIDLSKDGRFVPKGSVMDKPQAHTKVGDVLFVRVGVGCIGRAAVVLMEDECGVADDYLYILRFRPDKMLPEFFVLLTQTDFFKQQLERCKRGTGTVTVPQKGLREILIPVPPISLQREFAEAYRQLHERHRKGAPVASELEKLVSRLERFLRGESNAGEKGIC